MWRSGNLPGGDPPHLRELLHQVLLGVEAAGGVHEERPDAAGLRRRDRVEEDCRGIGALAVTHDGHLQAIGPDRELLDRSRAERVRRRQEDRTPLFEPARGELGRRRRLPGTVDADQEDDLERRVGGRRRAAGAAAIRRSISSVRSRRRPSRSVRSAPPDRVRTALASAPAVSAPTSASISASSSDSRTDSSKPRPFLTAEPSFSMISVWVMNNPRLTFAKKPDRGSFGHGCRSRSWGESQVQVSRLCEVPLRSLIAS